VFIQDDRKVALPKLKGLKNKKNYLSVRTVKRRKANWICHILLRNCLIKHVIEGKLEGRLEMTGIRCKQVLDDLKEKRRY
jgi:hypothetical protein